MTEKTPNISLTSLVETVSGNLQSWVTELVTKLIEEYQCETSLEKSLCEIIANSYGRIISTSKLMNKDLKLEYPSKEKMQYLTILSKELDRQNRTYFAAINTLMEIKNPNMSINLNSTNTFLAQNQSISPNWMHHENIKD